MLVFLLCVTLSFAEFTWVENIDDETLTLYHQDIDDVDNYNRTGYTYSLSTDWDGSKINTFILLEDLPFSKFVISNTIPHETESSEGSNFVIYYNASIPNLKTFQFMNYYSNYGLLYFNYNVETKIQLLLGCFGSQTGCVTEYGWGWTSIYLREAPMSIIGDDVNHNIAIFYDVIYDDPFSYTYLFIDGITRQTIIFKFGSLTNKQLSSYSTMYYMFTVPTKHYYLEFHGSDWATSTEFKGESVCSRRNTNRYILFTKDQTPYTNCSCWTKYNETVLTVDSMFNYPDCKYNSTMFDLVLPSSSRTYSLSDDLLEWYSIIFRTSSQSVKINDEKTLTIDELDLNQVDISFNGNVYVKNLNVTIPGTSFNVLDFDTINYDSNYYTTALFSISSTSVNLENHDLKMCGNSVFISTGRLSCNYNNSDYLNESDEIDSFCGEMKQTYCNNLIIQSSEYATVSVENWYSLSFGDLDVTISGLFALNSNTCYFEDKTITINGELYCSTMFMSSNTKLIINGNLTIDTLMFNGEINNLNQIGLIELYGIITIQTLSIESTQSNCFEFISSNSMIPIPIVLNDYSILSLSQDHLLRVCPSNNLNYDVTCTLTGNTFDYTSFNLIHCPCSDENCIINVNTNELNSLFNEFNGTFNIQRNTKLAISYKTSKFNVIFDESNQIIILGSGATGFELTKTTSIKSVSISYTITTSNQLHCKALLMEADQYNCLLEDDKEYPELGSIENCQTYNGFGCEVCYEGYESNLTYCSKCPDNCIRCFEDICLNCKVNYFLNTEGICEEINDPYMITFDNNKVLQCNDSYYSDTTSCNECLFDDCISCNSTNCLICDNNFILNNGNCELMDEIKGEEIVSNYGVVDCIDGYYSNNSQCITCTDIDESCDICNVNGCLICKDEMEFIDENGKCSIDYECDYIVNSKCLSCIDSGSWFNGTVCKECGDNCKYCVNGYCIECDDDYILESENMCVYNGSIENCEYLTIRGLCSRCSDGYYLENSICNKCPSECTKCHNSEYCLGCKDGYMLDDNECLNMLVINGNCKTPIPGSAGKCAVCNEGYYRDGTTCSPCIEDCVSCLNEDTCINCDVDHFLLSDASECISYDELTNCETKTKSGCSKCLDGYYLNSQYCDLCSDKTENCKTCKNGGECLTCQNDYILVNQQCVHYSLVEKCKKLKF